MPRDEAVLLDISRAANLALGFAQGLDERSFIYDLKTQSAVLHQLLVIGEAVKRLSDDFRSAHPQIPWRLIASMRDHLIHAYDVVDLEEVWKVVQCDLPDLLEQIKPHLPSNNP